MSSGARRLAEFPARRRDRGDLARRERFFQGQRAALMCSDYGSWGPKFRFPKKAAKYSSGGPPSQLIGHHYDGTPTDAVGIGRTTKHYQRCLKTTAKWRTPEWRQLPFTSLQVGNFGLVIRRIRDQSRTEWIPDLVGCSGLWKEQEWDLNVVWRHSAREITEGSEFIEESAVPVGTGRVGGGSPEYKVTFLFRNRVNIRASCRSGTFLGSERNSTLISSPPPTQLNITPLKRLHPGDLSRR